MRLTSKSGKQGKAAHADEPTRHVSPVNVQRNNDAPPANANHYAHTDPNMAHIQQHPAPDHYAYSMADGNNQNRAAQAGNAAAHAADAQQKKKAATKKVDQEDLARIVAEENESKGRLPRYPGLERWQLIEKMGDGAFSNVYKARDLEGQAGEVAIKVVRKFEMNSSQVSTITTESSFLSVCP